MDAKKETISGKDALNALNGVNELYVAKGKKITHVNLKKERPDDDELLKLMLGPTGNLRAPTVRKGKTLMVGFHEDTYAELFG